jgi:quercetin dioxygenase-like cupin family protein
MTSTTHTHLVTPTEGSAVLASASGPDTYRTEVVALQPGELWTAPEGPVDVQLLVVEGGVEREGGRRGPGAFLRSIGTEPFQVQASQEGCRCLVKTRPAGPVAPHESPSAFVDPAESPWAHGHGGLRVMPLDERGTEHTALVLWPAGERFVPHRHMGGEEIFVLSGTFRDEHGAYPAGTWIQSPHGSVHHPYVEEETLIWVKTGHLPPSGA